MLTAQGIVFKSKGQDGALDSERQKDIKLTEIVKNELAEKKEKEK